MYGPPACASLTYRPEYSHGWGGKPYYRQLQIEPLPPATAEDLLDGFFGNDSSLGSLRRLLIERTEGNPFFLEESVRALVETRTLVGERRAYRLAGALGALQAAAVIGKDVPGALLARHC